jgi:hypothetical protein
MYNITMNNSTFIPEEFQIPEKLLKNDFIIRKLVAKDVYLDYIAVMSSINIIKKTRGGIWPSPDLSFEDDMIDLAWHQREFEHKSSFAYTVMNLEESECLGCLYLYPPGTRSENSRNSDVDVSFWVTQSAYGKGFYKVLYNELSRWLTEYWKFKKIGYTNIQLP